VIALPQMILGLAALAGTGLAAVALARPPRGRLRWTFALGMAMFALEAVAGLIVTGYTETPSEYKEVVDRLLRKHKASARFVPAPEIRKREGAQFGVVTLGGCTPAVNEALEILAAQGITADFMRVRGFPFDEEVEAFLCEHEFCFVVEQNRDAQLRSLFLLETPVAKEQLRSVLVYGGFPLSARDVVKHITMQLEKPECLLSQSQS